MERSWSVQKRCKCRYCGEKFTVEHPKLYVYKIHDGGRVQYFCIWSHMEAWRREHEKPKKLKGGEEYAV